MAVTRSQAREIASAIRSSVGKHRFADATTHFLKCRYSPSAQRLAGHAFLHALWRLGAKSMPHLYKNFTILSGIVDAGVRLHPRSVAIHFREMIERSTDASSGFPYRPIIASGSILQKKTIYADNVPLRSATRLFWILGQTSHIRTQEMFVSLIAALLKHEEHLAAALAFDKVAQDHALRLALPTAIEQAKASGSSDYEALKKRLHHLEAENLLPDLASLTLIAKKLAALIQHPTEIHNREFAHCIQSAVVLGALLDRDQLPKEGKPVVISLLRDVIRSQTIDNRYRPYVYRSFVDVEPDPIAVNAVRYAHQILVAYLKSQGIRQSLSTFLKT